MYLLPLNADEAFKKVFENADIAKAFIEDMLDVQVDEIKRMPTDHRITNESALVRFDYRCKIKEEYVIIEMQQGYKPDVVKRFYIYHCLGTALQLETITETIRHDRHGNEYKTRNYNELGKVITMVWLVQDDFNLNLNLIEYNLYPKYLLDFVFDELLWRDTIENIKKRREELLKMLQDRRNLSFLGENRLIFAFQTNIIKNKPQTRYAKWFEFAEKTRNPNNKAEDFKNYSDNLIFSKIMNRLLINHADNQDLIKEMGFETYQRAKKLGQEAELRELREYFYWQIYDEISGGWDATLDAAKNRAYDAEFQAMKLAQTLEKERIEAQKTLEKEKLEAQKTLEKEKKEAQKLLEKEKKEAQKLLEKEKLSRIETNKALQEEKKKAKKLEQEQKKFAEKEQKRAQILLEQEKIKLMSNLLKAGLAIDWVAKSLGVSVQQIDVWMKLKK